MSLIDSTYFVGELSVPNSDKDYVLERLQYFIDKKEPQLLQDIFGYELYKLLAIELEQEEENSPTPMEPRFERIVHGAEYTGQDTKLHYWNGLVFISEDGTVKQSLIADYIYWHWLKDQNSQTVGLGEVATQAQNAVLTSPVIKMNRVWNEMSRMVAELYYFLQSNRDDYPEWVNSNWIYRQRFFAPQNQFGI